MTDSDRQKPILSVLLRAAILSVVIATSANAAGPAPGTEGWQGGRPSASEQTIPTPVPQSPVPSDQQVLEFPYPGTRGNQRIEKLKGATFGPIRRRNVLRSTSW